jgi:hypothetical protein
MSEFDAATRIPGWISSEIWITGMKQTVFPEQPVFPVNQSNP